MGEAGGSIPPHRPPPRGGRGYSRDPEERRLEWQMDNIMRRRIKEDIPLLDVVPYIERLQEYRAANGITGRTDERVGKPLTPEERQVIVVLVSEGRNVTSLARKKSGEPTPDIAVDAKLAEIKTSTGHNAAAFAERVAQVRIEQQTDRVFVNAVTSQIPVQAMRATVARVVGSGAARYVRIIGRDYDETYGRWS